MSNLPVVRVVLVGSLMSQDMRKGCIPREDEIIKFQFSKKIQEKILEEYNISRIFCASDGPLATADDGVVKYRSAHIPYADSELVVRHSGHSTQSNPITIAEVRRILLEHLAHLTPGVPETGDMNKQNITRIGGEYQPTTPPVHP